MGITATCNSTQLPKDLREAVAFQIKQEEKQEQKLTAKDVLDSLTTIRRQTAIAPQSGTADKGSLREKGAKFDLELLEAGTKFDLYFELLIDRQDNKMLKCGTELMKNL